MMGTRSASTVLSRAKRNSPERKLKTTNTHWDRISLTQTWGQWCFTLNPVMDLTSGFVDASFSSLAEEASLSISIVVEGASSAIDSLALTDKSGVAEFGIFDKEMTLCQLRIESVEGEG